MVAALWAPGLAAGSRPVWRPVRPVGRRWRGWRGWRPAFGVMLFIHAGFLAEGLALVQDPQRLLGQRGFLPGGGGAADVALGEPLEHPDSLHAGPGVQERADQGGDGQVAR